MSLDSHTVRKSLSSSIVIARQPAELLHSYYKVVYQECSLKHIGFPHTGALQDGDVHLCGNWIIEMKDGAWDFLVLVSDRTRSYSPFKTWTVMRTVAVWFRLDVIDSDESTGCRWILVAMLQNLICPNQPHSCKVIEKSTSFYQEAKVKIHKWPISVSYRSLIMKTEFQTL